MAYATALGAVVIIGLLIAAVDLALTYYQRIKHRRRRP